MLTVGSVLVVLPNAWPMVPVNVQLERPDNIARSNVVLVINQYVLAMADASGMI
jgi:hypothetical protein